MYKGSIIRAKNKVSNLTSSDGEHVNAFKLFGGKQLTPLGPQNITVSKADNLFPFQQVCLLKGSFCLFFFFFIHLRECVLGSVA